MHFLFQGRLPFQMTRLLWAKCAKCLHFQMVQVFNWNMFATISCYSLSLSFGLYQCTLDSNSVSPMLLVRFILEFVGIFTWYYCLCHSSDTLDECQRKLALSLYYSDWYLCSRRTQKDLIVFLRRLQKPNYLTFNRGSLVLNKDFFARVVDFAYSLVNCIRQVSNIKVEVG
uniref:Uncharacterized protein n=1 Tax=Cacopsylla melanoneura TaxID=428564 RepID=A0A8D8R2P8_9HEMI